MDWNSDFYKTGYEGYEQLGNFVTHQALEDYRQLLIKKTEEQVKFIARHLPARKLRVIEFCSGNSRLMMALALKGMLEYGLGVDISRSRIEFAQRWASDLDVHNIHNVQADVLEFSDFPPASFDLVVCITGAFNYFYPIHEIAPAQLLCKMSSALAPGGRLLLELYQTTEKRRQMLALNDYKLRSWNPLPPQDRFAYYLDDDEYVGDRSLLRHRKIFIGRDGTIDAGREEVLKYYTRNEATVLLNENGFRLILCDENFKEDSHHEGKSSAMVILAAMTLH